MAEENIIIYHDPCLDGALSMFAAHKKFGDSAQYIGADPNRNLADILLGLKTKGINPGTTIHFADIAPSLEALKNLLEGLDESCRIVILDHHKTNIDELKDFSHPQVDLHLDLVLSGSALSWEFFVGGERPPIAQIVDMIDMGKLVRRKDFAVAAVIDEKPIGSVDDIIATFSALETLNLGTLIERGISKIETQEDFFRKARRKGHWVDILNEEGEVAFTTLALNIEIQSGRYFAHLLQQEADASPAGFIVVYSVNNDNSVSVSYRSNGAIDVSEIAGQIGARTNGGGGHKNVAAGRIATLAEFQEIFQQTNQADRFKAGLAVLRQKTRA